VFSRPVGANKEGTAVKKNYVLIDYENVQPEEMDALEKEHFSVIVFVGANQAKVTFEVASVLQRMGDRASYIKISGSGKNALDFHIAYYLGKLSEKEPDAFFYIVSKDTGFDLLVEHLKAKKVSVGRVKCVTGLPLVKAAISKSSTNRVSVVIGILAKSGAARPRTVKTLASAINSMFQKSLSESEIAGIISQLTKKGVVVVNQTKVSYVIPGGR